MSENLTKEVDRFQDVVFKVIDSSLDERVKSFMWEHFFPDEPISRSLDIQRVPWLDRLFHDDVLKDRSSMAALGKDGEILAVRLGKVVRKEDHFNRALERFMISLLKYCGWGGNLYKMKIYAKVGELIKFNIGEYFKQYNCTKIYECKALCSARSHGIKGLGTEMVRRTEELSKELGCTHSFVFVTGKYSQRVFERSGYKEINRLVYDDFRMENGELFLKDTREHTMAVAYMKEYA